MVPPSASSTDTTTAIIAAVAALAGAAVGAAVGGLVTYSLERRREKATALAAARIVRTDLKTVAEQVGLVRNDGNWRVYFDWSFHSWTTYRAALATALKPDQWAAVDEAARVVRAMGDSVAKLNTLGTPMGPMLPLGPRAIQSLTGISDRVRIAYDELAGLAQAERAGDDFGEPVELDPGS